MDGYTQQQYTELKIAILLLVVESRSRAQQRRPESHEFAFLPPTSKRKRSLFARDEARLSGLSFFRFLSLLAQMSKHNLFRPGRRTHCYSMNTARQSRSLAAKFCCQFGVVAWLEDMCVQGQFASLWIHIITRAEMPIRTSL